MKHTNSICLALLLLIPAGTASAADSDKISQGDLAPSSSVGDYFANWFTRVAATQAEQPHWAPPVATTSPTLTEVLRYDTMWQTLPNTHTLGIFGSGKGLELIPAERVEVIIGVPAWQTQAASATRQKNGFADESLLVKYRLAAANEENGNYVVSAFLGLTAPTGSGNYTTHRYVFTPTLALGKGWGDFNLQSTLALSVPDNGATTKGLGTPFVDCLTAQYRLGKVFWPEVELNYTYWPNGAHEGLNQLFVTPGVVLGKLPVWRRLGIMVGAGYQVALTDKALYRQNFILTARLPF